MVAIPTKEPEKVPEILINQKAEPEKRTSQIMAEIRRNISSKKRQTQKDRDDKDLEKSKKVNEKLHNLIKEKTPEPIVTKEDDEPGNVFDYSFKVVVNKSIIGQLQCLTKNRIDKLRYNPCIIQAV